MSVDLSKPDHVVTTITYAKGIVKQFLVPGDMSFGRFVEQVNKVGRIRRLDIHQTAVRDRATFDLLIATGHEVLT